jgi:thiamine biosynthesis lipoprotein
VAVLKISPKLEQFVLVLFLLAAFAGAAAGAGQELLRIEKSAEAMGTSYAVVAYGHDRMKLESAVEAAFDEVQRIDNLLSNYKPASEWSEINRDAAERPVRVSGELFQLLSACQRYSRESEGAFDITVGPLMKLWGFYKGSGRLPHRAEVRTVLGRLGYRHMLLDAANQTVRFDRKGVEIDPGGIGKGYAVDRMVQVLKEYGLTTALVSGGGSSIYALGAPPSDARGWKLDIKDPKSPRKAIESVYLKNESMSTSGSYEKFFRAGGRIFSHIMDPRTGWPAAGMLAVSVIAPTTIDSEAWSKPYYINGRAWAAKHKPKDFRAFLCEDRTDKACAWLQ